MTPVDDAPALKLAEAAHALVRQGRFAQAWQAVDLALSVDADLANAHTLKAHLLERRGAFNDALPHWREAVRLQPAAPGHRFNLALALLGAGCLAEGFALQEARLEKTDWNSLAMAGSFAGLRQRVPRPGDDLSGKRVLAFTEQGLGDMLWAARFLPAMATRCGVLDLACPPSLRPLLGDRPGGDLLGPPDEQPGARLNLSALSGRYDAFLPLMSLPHVLGCTEPTPGVPWLAADRALTAEWRARLAAALPGRRIIVGVVWRANPENGSAAERSFPPSVLAGLAQPDIGVVNLQGGAPAGREALAAALPDAIDPLGEGDPPLDVLAAMLAATNLLITADTMAAHLAGALGHPAWVAVPAVANFYWMQRGETTPWYPRARLFRQAVGADWTAVGASMVQAVSTAP